MVEGLVGGSVPGDTVEETLKVLHKLALQVQTLSWVAVEHARPHRVAVRTRGPVVLVLRVIGAEDVVYTNIALIEPAVGWIQEAAQC